MADYNIEITEVQTEYEYLLNIRSFKLTEGAKTPLRWHVSQADPNVFAYVDICPNGSNCVDVIQDAGADFSGEINAYLLKFAFVPGSPNGTFNIFLEQDESLLLLNIEVLRNVSGLFCPEIGDITASNMRKFFSSLQGCTILHLMSYGSDGLFKFSGGYYAKINGEINTSLNTFQTDIEKTIQVCNAGVLFYRFAYELDNLANEGVGINGNQPNVKINNVNYWRLCSFSNPDPNGSFVVKFNAETTLYLIKSNNVIIQSISVAANTYVDLLNLHNNNMDAHIIIEQGQNITATFESTAYGDSLVESQIIF